MPTTKSLNAAKSAKKDEFYTQLSDIEKELKYHKDHFRNKVVYCNCDDPTVSNFFRYFFLNFNKLGLKKLITTCYKNQNSDLFSQHNQEKAIGIEYVGDHNPNLENINVFQLEGDGDFRSEECIELLKQSDIVVTNPPFSLFREYLAQLAKHSKKFLIIGNLNSVTSKEVFPLIKDNIIWLGTSIKSGDREFQVPEYYPLTASSFRIDEQGRRFVRVKGVRWFTNIDFRQRHENLILYKKYTPDDFVKFDNYDAVNVDKTKDIPMDYSGVMGVPVSFLDKHNPDQFEILEVTDTSSELRTKKYSANDAPNYSSLNGRGVIRRGDKLEKKYARILIRRL